MPAKWMEGIVVVLSMHTEFFFFIFSGTIIKLGSYILSIPVAYPKNHGGEGTPNIF